MRVLCYLLVLHVLLITKLLLHLVILFLSPISFLLSPISFCFSILVICCNLVLVFISTSLLFDALHLLESYDYLTPTTTGINHHDPPHNQQQQQQQQERKEHQPTSTLICETSQTTTTHPLLTHIYAHNKHPHSSQPIENEQTVEKLQQHRPHSLQPMAHHPFHTSLTKSSSSSPSYLILSHQCQADTDITPMIDSEGMSSTSSHGLIFHIHALNVYNRHSHNTHQSITLSSLDTHVSSDHASTGAAAVAAQEWIFELILENKNK